MCHADITRVSRSHSRIVPIRAHGRPRRRPPGGCRIGVQVISVGSGCCGAEPARRSSMVRVSAGPSCNRSRICSAMPTRSSANRTRRSPDASRNRSGEPVQIGDGQEPVRVGRELLPLPLPVVPVRGEKIGSGARGCLCCTRLDRVCRSTRRRRPRCARDRATGCAPIRPALPPLTRRLALQDTSEVISSGARETGATGCGAVW